MRYDEGHQLRLDAERVSHGVAVNQSQESLDEQLKDLRVLATRFGLRDVGDWLKDAASYRERYRYDFGEFPSTFPDRIASDAEPGVDRYDPGRC